VGSLGERGLGDSNVGRGMGRPPKHHDDKGNIALHSFGENRRVQDALRKENFRCQLSIED